MSSENATQIQIRRGTADEHAEFIGAVGEVTMDTTNNTLCVHDGQTAGGVPLARKSELGNLARRDELVPSTADYVTQYYRASDSSSWYRKYKSGWVEQGGYWSGSKSISAGSSGTFRVTFSVKMKDTKYLRVANTANLEYCVSSGCYNPTQTAMSVVMIAMGATRTLTGFTWYVAGQAA